MGFGLAELLGADGWAEYPLSPWDNFYTLVVPALERALPAAAVLLAGMAAAVALRRRARVAARRVFDGCGLLLLAEGYDVLGPWLWAELGPGLAAPGRWSSGIPYGWPGLAAYRLIQAAGLLVLTSGAWAGRDRR